MEADRHTDRHIEWSQTDTRIDIKMETLEANKHTNLTPWNLQPVEREGVRVCVCACASVCMRVRVRVCVCVREREREREREKGKRYRAVPSFQSVCIRVGVHVYTPHEISMAPPLVKPPRCTHTAGNNRNRYAIKYSREHVGYVLGDHTNLGGLRARPPG